jgi:hypothetical protein
MGVLGGILVLSPEGGTSQPVCISPTDLRNHPNNPQTAIEYQQDSRSYPAEDPKDSRKISGHSSPYRNERPVRRLTKVIIAGANNPGSTL